MLIAITKAAEQDRRCGQNGDPHQKTQKSHSGDIASPEWLFVNTNIGVRKTVHPEMNIANVPGW